jgi:hypothetical protein
MAIFDDLPAKIHLFVQVPIVREKHVEEPQIYWSMNTHVHETGSIPPAVFTIKMCWLTCVEAARWEGHHYEVAEAALKRHEFNPATNAAAQSLNPPPLAPVESSNQREYGKFLFVSWQMSMCVYLSSIKRIEWDRATSKGFTYSTDYRDLEYATINMHIYAPYDQPH